MILHFSHIGLTDGRTFMIPFGSREPATPALAAARGCRYRSRTCAHAEAHRTDTIAEGCPPARAPKHPGKRDRAAVSQASRSPRIPLVRDISITRRASLDR